jgi:hypothetical protein
VFAAQISGGTARASSGRSNKTANVVRGPDLRREPFVGEQNRDIEGGILQREIAPPE